MRVQQIRSSLNSDWIKLVWQQKANKSHFEVYSNHHQTILITGCTTKQNVDQAKFYCSITVVLTHWTHQNNVTTGVDILSQ